MESASHPPNPDATAPPARESAAWGSVPTVDDVDRIIALADPVIRNLQVTRAYCELSRGITAIAGTVTNWCTYATWASKQAGVTIRQEDLARTLERLLQHSPEVWEAIDRVAMSLAQLDRRRDAAGLRPSIRQLLDPRVIFERTSAAAQLAERLRVIARRTTTECLMTLSLPPDLVLQLGRDLPVDFPETLRQLSHPELQALLARIDPTLDSVQQSGADDWADFNDRMHFIADLFRAYAEYPQLFDPAFTPDQVLDIKAGRKPAGRL